MRKRRGLQAVARELLQQVGGRGLPRRLAPFATQCLDSGREYPSLYFCSGCEEGAAHSTGTGTQVGGCVASGPAATASRSNKRCAAGAWDVSLGAARPAFICTYCWRCLPARHRCFRTRRSGTLGVGAPGPSIAHALARRGLRPPRRAPLDGGAPQPSFVAWGATKRS